MFNYFKNSHAVTIDPLSVVFLVLTVLCIYFLFLIKSILVLLLLSFILMVALHPIVVILQKKLRIPKTTAIVLSYIFLLLVIFSFIGLVVPPLAQQFIGFVSKLELPGLEKYYKDISFNLQELSTIIERMSQSASVVFSVINSAFTSAFTFMTLFVVSFYLMLERNRLHEKAVWFTQDRAKIAQIEKFINAAEEQLGGWVRGQLLLMLTIGIVTLVGLTILRIPYALPLALTAGLLEILPNLGPTIAAIPAIVIAYLTFGPISAVIMLIFYIIVQQLENNILVPRIMAANANVSPLVSIVAILIGFEIGSVIGALLAIPIYIILRLLYSTFFLPQIRK
jgi:predicted PurR-regulated permease PerM